MKVKTIEEITLVLDKIDAQVKHLETSSNRLFVLTECDTLSSFHVFNLCLKQFWDEFDCHSARQLLLYQKIDIKYTELSNRYESLLREQIDYLENALDLDGKNIIDLAPFLFQEYGTDVIGYYNECLKDETDKEGKPFYKLELDNNSRTLYIDNSGKAVNSYLFHSDILNYHHYTSLLGMKKCLKGIYKLMCVVTSYPKVLLSGYNPSQEEIIRAIESGLQQYAKNEKWDVERNLKKIAQELKPARNSSLDSNIWGLVMENEDELYDLIITDNLDESDDKFLEHIFATKEQLIDNSSLLQKIKSTCLDEELFDIGRSVITHQLLKSLNADNLDLFYELVLRRNIIQCEMFPEKLKDRYEEWVNQSEEQQSGDTKINNCQEGTTPKETNASKLEIGIQRSLERLMQERIKIKKGGKEVEEPLFNLQNHWQGVYRILVDKKYSMDADFEGFDTFICKVMPKAINKPYSKESVKQISKTDYNIPFEKWKYNGETSGKRNIYERMYTVTKRFKEILEEEGL